MQLYTSVSPKPAHCKELVYMVHGLSPAAFLLLRSHVHLASQTTAKLLTMLQDDLHMFSPKIFMTLETLARMKIHSLTSLTSLTSFQTLSGQHDGVALACRNSDHDSVNEFNTPTRDCMQRFSHSHIFASFASMHVLYMVTQ